MHMEVLSYHVFPYCVGLALYLTAKDDGPYAMHQNVKVDGNGKGVLKTSLRLHAFIFILFAWFRIDTFHLIKGCGC